MHENGIAIKVKLYLSRDSEHLIEAYLAALTVNATFIIGKFTETTTAKMELDDTLTLINELGIPLEIITATNQSYKGTQHLLEEAQQKEQQLEAYTLKEIETTLISKKSLQRDIHAASGCPNPRSSMDYAFVGDGVFA